ncbi:probable fructose-2,6-bisphosphatase TIGAR A isoform X1 [Synchiropus splendidus]|uniref:probable fructose-2,6-bisphosphatase TIGAR A isoform X1 n=1 Tax=Synchiropus splendidus TaxID=270530 RepID=UPI00237DB8CD|nr:probable fructose-2,6-bisphosphatase TIGAR A isoform X1 [Synchiropus splendidus]
MTPVMSEFEYRKAPYRSASALKKLVTADMTTFVCGLTLVRHGETQYNKDGLLQGQSVDLPLSEIGLQQAQAAAEFLKQVHFSHVFASDMLRAQETAQTIAKVNRSCSGLQVMCDPLLKEISFGMAEGGPMQVVKEMAAAAGQVFPGFTPPGGETQEQVKLRFVQFWGKMLQKIGSNIQTEPNDRFSSGLSTVPPNVTVCDLPRHALLVSHGAYMCVAVRYLVQDLGCTLPQGCDEAKMFALSPNAGISHFTLTLRKDGDSVQVLGVNCQVINKGVDK